MGKRILVTGLPGAGKTTLGDYLSSHEGFRHRNIEDTERESYQEISRDPYGAVERWARDPQDVVVTWGFPVQAVSLVRFFAQKDFDLIWLEGDLVKLRAVFADREERKRAAGQRPIPLVNFDIQVASIARSGVVADIRPRHIHVLDETGSFRPMEEIAREVLQRDRV